MYKYIINALEKYLEHNNKAFNSDSNASERGYKWVNQS